MLWPKTVLGDGQRVAEERLGFLQSVCDSQQFCEIVKAVGNIRMIGTESLF